MKRAAAPLAHLGAALALASSTLAAPGPDANRLRDLPPHPRLCLPRGGDAALRARADSHPHLAAIRDRVLARAEAFLESRPVTAAKSGRRMLHQSRRAMDTVTHCAMAYRLAGNPRHLDRARAEMLAAAAFKDWNPSHFLDVAEMTAALALGYDWLHAELSAPDRATIRNAIIRLGLQQSFVGRQFWVDGTNNWNQVCHGGLTLGALAVADHEPDLAARVIRRAIAGVPRVLERYEPDGAYPEGAVYWVYGTSYHVLLVAALESALGSDFGLAAPAAFQKTPEYLLHITGPSGAFYNYADCGSHADLLPALHWFAARRNEPALLHFESRKLEAQPGNRKPGNSDERFVPLSLAWLQPAATPPDPATLDWVGRGTNPVAFFRAAWTPDAAYLGLKGGSASTSHAHMDAGSFVFESGGVRWVNDLGAQSYTELEQQGVDLWNMKQNSQRWSLFRFGNHGHSTLRLIGRRYAVTGTATISATGLGSTSPGATVDLTPCFAGEAGRVTRTFRFQDRRSLTIEDALDGLARSGTVRWQIVTGASISLTSSGATLASGDRRLAVRQTSGSPGTWLAIDASQPQKPYDAPNPGISLLALDLPATQGQPLRFTVELAPDP